MANSTYWLNHFKENQKKEQINWNSKPEISNQEKRLIIRSMQAWQKGETSDGTHLLAAAKKYAAKHNNIAYLEAIKLFIKEEQKHGEYLGKYLDKIGEKRLGFDLGDQLFRWVRYAFTSMEIWTITVILVESFAQLYYKALSHATKCPLLASICHAILRDEAHHIRFQHERLMVILKDRHPALLQLTYFLYFCLFQLITVSVWFEGHSNVFKAGGINGHIYLSKAHKKFFGMLEILERNRLSKPQTKINY